MSSCSRSPREADSDAADRSRDGAPDGRNDPCRTWISLFLAALTKVWDWSRDYLEIRCFREKERAGVPPDAAGRARYAESEWFGNPAPAVEWALGRDALEDHPRVVCVGVNPRIEGGGKKSDLTGVAALHVDIDLREGETLEDLRQRTLTFRPQPSAVMASGGGLHVYWYLSKVYRTMPSREKAERINRALAWQLQGDTAASDISRVLRLPGTRHRKDPENPKVCRLLQDMWRPDQRYSLQDFDDLIVEPAEERATKAGNRDNHKTSGPRVPRPEVLPRAYVDVDDLPFPVPDDLRAAIKEGVCPNGIKSSW